MDHRQIAKFVIKKIDPANPGPKHKVTVVLYFFTTFDPSQHHHVMQMLENMMLAQRTVNDIVNFGVIEYPTNNVSRISTDRVNNLFIQHEQLEQAHNELLKEAEDLKRQLDDSHNDYTNE